LKRDRPGVPGHRDQDSPHRRLRVRGEGADEMTGFIDDLLNMSGGDGDFIRAAADPREIDLLLGAWSKERGRSIECLLLLGRVRRLLCRILESGRLTDQNGREVKGLLRLIDSLGKDVPPIER